MYHPFLFTYNVSVVAIIRCTDKFIVIYAAHLRRLAAPTGGIYAGVNVHYYASRNL